MDAVATLVSGSISGAVADAITHPISTVKTRLQVQGAAAAMGEGGVAKMALYRGPVHATSAIIKSEGVFALYTGLGAVLAAAISASLAARVLAASAPSSPPLTYTSSNSHAFEKVAVLSQFGVLPVG